MKVLNIPGFTAEDSLYRTGGHYQAGRRAINSPTQMVIPAIPLCQNCPDILDRCAINGGFPRAVCNACAIGHCADEPPEPDPFRDPFGLLPRF